MENNHQFTEQEVYEIATDAYKQTHKLSYLLLHRALKSVLKRLSEDCVIYLLMQEMSVNHKTKNVWIDYTISREHSKQNIFHSKTEQNSHYDKVVCNKLFSNCVCSMLQIVICHIDWYKQSCHSKQIKRTE